MSDELIARLVKPLEWKRNAETGGWYGVGCNEARYQIAHRPAFDRRPYECYYDDGDGPAPALGYFPDLAAAKADAQADYTARILAALDADALARLTAENEALKVKAEGLARTSKTLLSYARWQIAEGGSYHPTLPSAAVAVDAALSAYRGDPE